MARPLRGGGGVKAGPLRKKELFLKLFFLFCCHLKMKIILLKTTYRNMGIFTCLLQYFPKSEAILVQKL